MENTACDIHFKSGGVLTIGIRSDVLPVVLTQLSLGKNVKVLRDGPGNSIFLMADDISYIRY